MSTEPKVSSSWHAMLVSAAAGLAGVAHAVLTGGELLTGDILNQTAPILGVMHGRVPILDAPSVNVMSGCAAPYLADIQTHVFYPPAWLFSVLSAQHAVIAAYALHLFIAALGMRALLEAAHVTPGVAVAASFAWALSPWMAMHHLHFNIVAATAWMAWVSLGVVKARTARDLPRLALPTAMMVLAGSPDMFPALACASVLIGLALHRSALLATAALIVMSMVLGILLAAPGWLPTLLWLPNSIREIQTQTGTLRYALEPLQALRALVPGIFGHPFEGYEGSGLGWEQFLSVSALAWMGVVVARSVDRRVLWVCGALALAALLLSSSADVGGAFTRVPARFGVLVTMASLMVGALGISRRFSDTAHDDRRLVAIWCAVLILVAVLLRRSVELDVGAPHATLSTLTTTAALAAIAAGMATRRAVLLVGGVVIEGAFAAWVMIPVAPAGSWEQTLAPAGAMKAAGGRVMHGPGATDLLNHGGVWGAATVRAYGPLLPLSAWRALSEVEGGDGPHLGASLMHVRDAYSERWRALGVRTVLDSADAAVPPGWNAVWQSQKWKLLRAPWDAQLATLEGGTVEQQHAPVDELHFLTNGPAGTLRIAVAALPGARVAVDGIERPWREKDGLMEVDVDVGRHAVVVRWEVPGLALAIALALVAAALLVVIRLRAR